VTFSAPVYTTTRIGNSIKIEITPLTSELLNGITVVEFLDDSGFEAVYEIDYYERMNMEIQEEVERSVLFKLAKSHNFGSHPDQ